VPKRERDASIRKTSNGRYLARMEWSRVFGSRADAERASRVVRDHFDRANKAIQFGLSPCITIREGLDEFLLSREAEYGVRPETLAAYRRRLERFAVDLSGDAGDIALERIRRADVLTWMIRRAREPGRGGLPVAPTTIKKELAALKTFGQWAIDLNLAPPTLEFMTIRKRAEGRKDGRRAPWLPMQDFLSTIQRIRAASEPVALGLWMMLAFGVRPEAVVSLHRRDVRRPRKGKDGVARFKILKKGDSGDVAVPAGSLREKLLARCDDLHRAYYPGKTIRGNYAVLPTRKGRSRRNPRGWSVQSFANEIRRVAERVGLPPDFSAYVMRHSAGTWLKQLGVSAAATRHFLKHRSIETQNVYDHTSGVDAAPAFAAMERELEPVFLRAFASGADDAPESIADIVLMDETV